MLADRRGAVELIVCRNCGAGCFDAAALKVVLGEAAPVVPPPPEHGYPDQYPQQIWGHVDGRAVPTFGPTWGLGPRSTSADAGGLLRGD